jgi:molybdenum cofactor cytidylyltransferase
MENKKELAIIILAAGKSSRLGLVTKQLLKYNGVTLLKRACKKALQITNDVFVVLGHEKEECEKEIKDYEKGIGSSISYGIKHTNDYKNTLIMLCDQPFINKKHLINLKNNIDNQTIIATKYENASSSTVPAIFPKKYYKKLSKLNEDKGAKSMMKNEVCINIKLEKSKSIDIDTREDIKTYLDL